MDKNIQDSQFFCTNMYSIFNEHIIYSVTNIEGVITNASKAFCKETGYDKKDILGNTHAFLKAPDFPQEVYTKLWDTITKNETWKGKINNLRKNGESYWINNIIEPIFNSENQKMGYLSIRQDITKEKSCEALSYIDDLTGAYNRRKFNLELNSFLIDYQRYNDNFSLVMMDIDHFKNFNDLYGHLVGDEVLKYVCKVMNSNIRQGDFFARWGGEEFVLLLNKVDKDIALKACDTLLNKIRLELPKFLFEEFAIKTGLTCSMGITSPLEADTVVSIVERVDSALYRAKRNGRNRTEII